MMRSKYLLLILVLFAAMFLPHPTTTHAAAATDFEAFAAGTLADSLTVPGVTFSTTSGSSPWQIYEPYLNPPYAEGRILGTLGGDTLTIRFATLQGAISFGYGALDNTPVQFFRGGVLVSSQSLAPTGINTYTGASFSIGDGFDTITIAPISDLVIDNLSTTDFITAAVSGPVPGIDMVAIPAGSVVGTFLTSTPLYYAPDPTAASSTVMDAGKTLWVIGVDKSGQFYKVLLVGKFYWVPINTMGPNYDSVWNGWPLPSQTVE